MRVGGKPTDVVAANQAGTRADRAARLPNNNDSFAAANPKEIAKMTTVAAPKSMEVTRKEIEAVLSPVQLAAGNNPFLVAIKSGDHAHALAIYSKVLSQYPKSQQEAASRLLVSQIRRLYQGSTPLSQTETDRYQQTIYKLCENPDFNAAYEKEFGV